MAMNEDGKMLCLTIFGYKKAGLSDEDYRAHMLNIHAKLASAQMEKFGIRRFTMTHCNQETRPILNQIVGPHFDNIHDCDVVSQIVFPNVKCFTDMLEDPYYREHVMPDDENFADMQNTRMTIGWIEDIVVNGKVQRKYNQADGT